MGRIRGINLLHRISCVFWYIGLIPDFGDDPRQSNQPDRKRKHTIYYRLVGVEAPVTGAVLKKYL